MHEDFKLDESMNSCPESAGMDPANLVRGRVVENGGIRGWVDRKTMTKKCTVLLDECLSGSANQKLA